MCAPNQISRGAGTTIPRPRWARLYAIAFVGVAALAIGNVAVPDGARSPIDALVTGGLFVAFALWIRGNRAALDQQDWCECAAETLTVRVSAPAHAETYNRACPWTITGAIPTPSWRVPARRKRASIAAS